MAQTSSTHDCNNPSEACPKCAQRKLRALEPGDTLQFVPGIYDKPLTLDGVRGSFNHPISLRGPGDWRVNWTGFDLLEDDVPEQPNRNIRWHAVFTTGTNAKKFRPIANQAALRKQATGEFPGLYFIGDEASLYLKNCQHVQIAGFYFDDCWPTAIYLDNCQEIGISHCQFRGGTFAIGATGRDTRHLTIERCHWRQHPDVKGYWKDVTWAQIHSHLSDDPDSNVGKVSIEDDWRLFDGDFFVGWRIAGFVTIRNNIIEDAFNAIHMFNESPNPLENLNKNVLIEGNLFRNIRDNAVEPERGAWNWIIRHNVFADVYRWFSIEMTVSGWFYIYGNFAWHTHFPGHAVGRRTGGSVFKASKKPVQADGPHYVFHNSWHLREPLLKLKKSEMRDWHFFNNAWSFGHRPEAFSGELPFMFGANLTKIGRLPKSRREGLAFNGNVIERFGDGGAVKPYTLKDYKDAGLEFGAGSVQDYPGFVAKTPNSVGDFKLGADAKAAGTGVGFEIKSHARQAWKVVEGGDAGAWEGERVFALDTEFEWLTNLDRDRQKRKQVCEPVQTYKGS